MVSLCLRLIIILKIKVPVPVDMLAMHIFFKLRRSIHVVLHVLNVCCMQMPVSAWCIAIGDDLFGDVLGRSRGMRVKMA